LRREKMSWTLAWENALTKAIADRLRSDLAGTVALALLERASFVWFMESRTALSHHPDDVDRLEETPALGEAARAIAEALRAEVDSDLLISEAERHIEGDFLYRTPRAIKLGQSVKRAPDLSDRSFGRLAPLGSVSLAAVIPWLGFEPARTLGDYFSWRFQDLPWIDGPELEVSPLVEEIWVRPRYRAINGAVEVAATCAQVPAVVARDGLQGLSFDCDAITLREPLGLALAKNLRLVSGDRALARVNRIPPVHVTGSPWEAFLDRTPGIDAARRSNGTIHLLCPFGEEAAPRQILKGKELVYNYLWLAREGVFEPVDPWLYAPIPPAHVSARETRDIAYFEFDESGYRAALAGLLHASRGQNPEDAAVSQVSRALREVHRNLADAEEAINSASELMDNVQLDEMVSAVANVRKEWGRKLQELEEAIAECLAPVESTQEQVADPKPVSRATGSPHRSVMPDGTVVESRNERFVYNAQVARKYFAEHGHLQPKKKDRPDGVNLYQWLKNQELQIRKGTILPDRKAVVEALEGWTERLAQQ
jgi:hypothetical protein